MVIEPPSSSCCQEIQNLMHDGTLQALAQRALIMTGIFSSFLISSPSVRGAILMSSSYGLLLNIFHAMGSPQSLPRRSWKQLTGGILLSAASGALAGPISHLFLQSIVVKTGMSAAFGFTYFSELFPFCPRIRFITPFSPTRARLAAFQPVRN